MRRIVILGGGYAALHATRVLRRSLALKLRSGEVDLKVVSRARHHAYHGWIGEVLSGRLAVERTLTDLPKLVGDHFLHGEAVSVDVAGKGVVVELADGGTTTLPYDDLLIATGSSDPFRRLPGLRENGWCLKDLNDMRRLCSEVEAVARRETPKARCVVVIGGGMAGVETASAVAERFRKAGATSTKVHLIAGGGGRLLEALRPDFDRLADHGERVLARQGVTVHLSSRAAEVLPGAVRLADGRLLPSDLSIVAAGIEFDILPGTESLPLTPDGRITTDRYLGVPGADGLWAAGDIADVKHPRRAGPCPVDALWAMKQGAAVGANIARAVLGREPKAFGFRGMGRAAGLARANGVAELYGIPLKGRLAWTLRVAFFAWYMPSRTMGARVILDLAGGGPRRWLAAARSAAEPGPERMWPAA